MDKEQLREHFAFLETLKTTSKRQRKQLLEVINRKQLRFLSQAAYNILLNPKLSIAPNRKKALKKRIGIIRKLASKKIPMLEKKSLILNNPYLIKLIAEVAATFMAEVL